MANFNMVALLVSKVPENQICILCGFAILRNMFNDTGMHLQCCEDPKNESIEIKD